MHFAFCEGSINIQNFIVVDSALTVFFGSFVLIPRRAKQPEKIVSSYIKYKQIIYMFYSTFINMFMLEFLYK